MFQKPNIETNQKKTKTCINDTKKETLFDLVGTMCENGFARVCDSNSLFKKRTTYVYFDFPSYEADALFVK